MRSTNIAKLKIEDLEKIARRMKKVIHLREGEAKAKIIVHMGTCGIAAGARAVMTALVEAIEKQDLSDVLVTISSCAGLCGQEPMITVAIQDQPPVRYVNMTAAKALEVLEKHVLGGRIVEAYALAANNK